MNVRQVRRDISVIHPASYSIIADPDHALGRRELQDKLEVLDREHFRKRYLKPALDAGWITMSNPENPTAADQKYSITNIGKSILAE